jgi:hypothetical protein
MEVVLIVLSLGSSSHDLGLAAVAATAAVVVVGAIGVAVSRQLSEVPENTTKMAVGVMLTSFGVFWCGEGAGVRWPGSDLSILWLVAGFALAAVAGIAWLRRLLPSEEVAAARAIPAGSSRPLDALQDKRVTERVARPGVGGVGAGLNRWAIAFGRFWWDFLVGDTPELFIGTLVIIGAAIGLRHERVADIAVTPVIALVVLFGSFASTLRVGERPA